MELFTLKCKQCGAAIKYVGGTDHLKCGACGAEYILRRDREDGNNRVRGIDYLGRGDLFTALCPKGWSCRVFDDNQSFSRLAAVCKGLRFDSGDGAYLILYPFSYYKDFDPNGAFGIGFSLRRNYQIDPVGFVRYRQLPELETYALEMLAQTFQGAVVSGSERMTDLDGVLRQRSEAFALEAAQRLGARVETDFGKFLIRFTAGERPMAALFASVIARREGLSRAQEARGSGESGPAAAAPKGFAGGIKGFLEFGMNGGLIGAKLRGEGGGTPKASIPSISGIVGAAGPNWGRLFDVLLAAPEEAIDGCGAIFNDFCASVQYGPLYYALCDEELRSAEQVMLDGDRQRVQNSINASRQLQRTLSETSDIVSSGYARRSQAMDRVNKNYSEAVRGVNAYETARGETVEVGVEYERVFENNGVFAGTKDAGAGPGAGWIELEKKK